MLNIRLMSHWENWVTILLMVLVGTFAANQLAKLFLSYEVDK
jgi:hypothetical protein